MDEDQKKDITLDQEYAKKVYEDIRAKQEENDIPSVYSFSIGKKNFVCSLPRSVMAQKRLVHAQNKMFREGTFEAESDFLKLVAENTTLDGRPLNLNDLEYSDIEVLRTAYIDQLLLPLSLGGDKSLTKYMKEVLGQK